MNIILFGAFPYIALVVCIIGTIVRYKVGFKYSSLSSQLLESKSLYTGSLPFHIGIIVIFLGHLIGFMWPSLYTSIGGSSLVNLEIAGLAFAFLALFGIIMLFYRRLTNDRLKVVTSKMDISIEIILIAQFLIGISMAVEMKWGSSWYASNMVPYLHSLFLLNPDIISMGAMPFMVKLHVFLAFLIILLIPFSRFVHFLVAPFHYISRPYQIVRWNWDRKTIRDPNTSWNDVKRPKNN